MGLGVVSWSESQSGQESARRYRAARLRVRSRQAWLRGGSQPSRARLSRSYEAPCFGAGAEQGRPQERLAALPGQRHLSHAALLDAARRPAVGRRRPSLWRHNKADGRGQAFAPAAQGSLKSESFPPR